MNMVLDHLKEPLIYLTEKKAHSNFHVSKQVLQFKETFMNISESFILQKQRPVMTKNKQIKAFIAENYPLYKRLKRKMLNSEFFLNLQLCKLIYKVRSIFRKLLIKVKTQRNYLIHLNSIKLNCCHQIIVAKFHPTFFILNLTNN